MRHLAGALLGSAVLLALGCSEPRLPPYIPRDGGRVPDGGALPDGGSSPDGGAPDGGASDGGGADGGGDGGTTCDARTVAPPADCANDTFTPDSPTEEWQHPFLTGLVVAQGGPRHRGIDLIVNPGQEQILIGKFAYGSFDDDLKDEKVEVWVRVACGQWRKLGTAMTSEDGEYGTVTGVEDDGGRVFFTVPAAMRLGLGDYPVKMLVKGDHSEANFWLHVWPSGVHAVVSDVDGTITTSENDGLWTAFDPSSPTARAGAQDLFAAYVSKGYRLAYLSARPEFLTRGTASWFRDKGFARGVFHLSQSNFGEFGDAAIAYKRGYLQGLVQNQGVLLDWAYGNKDSDLLAYLQAGVTPSHIYLYEGEYSGDLMGANRIATYAAEIERVMCLPPVTQP